MLFGLLSSDPDVSLCIHEEEEYKGQWAALFFTVWGKSYLDSYDSYDCESACQAAIDEDMAWLKEDPDNYCIKVNPEVTLWLEDISFVIPFPKE